MSNRQGEIWQWDARQVADGIRKKEISSREATLSNLARLRQVNPAINAVVDILEDEALAAATEADQMLMNGGELGLLHGVPITTKISSAYRGRPTTVGVVAFKDNIASEDCSAVRNLRKAGAVILGLTNVPAFTARYFSDNDLHGRTHNPWHNGITPGGSSGGAASAVAAGIGALAHGTDRAGSVRYPSYACGVPGIRPSLGRAPSYRGDAEKTTPLCFLQQAATTDGMHARKVGDLRDALAALAQPDDRDMSWYAPAPLTWPDSGAPRRVALLRQIDGFKPVAGVDTALTAAAKALEAAGYHIEEVALPRFAEAADLFVKLLVNEDRASFGDLRLNLGDERVRKSVLGWRSKTTDISLREYADATGRRRQIIVAWEAFFKTYPLVITPCSAMLPFPLDYDQGGDAKMREILDANMPMLAVALTGCAALAVPTGIVDGIPTGVQLLAQRFREDICFDAGEVIERACPMATPVTPFPN